MLCPMHGRSNIPEFHPAQESFCQMLVCGLWQWVASRTKP
jgi:hypothetical protein